MNDDGPKVSDDITISRSTLLILTDAVGIALSAAEENYGQWRRKRQHNDYVREQVVIWSDTLDWLKPLHRLLQKLNTVKDANADE
jgi:hypothetical protein